MVKKNNSILYGILAGTGLILFYLTVVSIFQGMEFAFLNLRSLWYLIFPLAIGFGMQIGLYTSIKHTAQMIGMVAATGTISGGIIAQFTNLGVPYILRIVMLMRIQQI